MKTKAERLDHLIILAKMYRPKWKIIEFVCVINGSKKQSYAISEPGMTYNYDTIDELEHAILTFFTKVNNQ